MSACFGRELPVLAQSKDVVTVAVEPEYNRVSKLHRKFFGENYRKLWATPVTMRVFHLSKEKGGLKIVGQGGGLQTRSLKLKDSAGNDWALRTVQKYPERALPKNMRKTIVKDILQDEVTTSHPFSALIVPPLAEVLHIPHSNPEIVYVSDDPALGEYRKDYANKVFLFEERDPLDIDKTDNTEKAQKKVEGDNDNRFNQRMVLRARLLDMIIGDWDRHEDQWRWDREKNDTGIVYQPIPRDRDKVFYTTSGIFPWVLAHQSLKSQLQPYRGDIRAISEWNFNARYFDRYFLTQLSKEDWEQEIRFVQQALTDNLIDSAMKRMPANIYKQSTWITPYIKQRRDNIEREGLSYYSFLADHVDIPGTDKHEQFDVDEQAGGKVAVTIRKIKKDGTPAQVIYQRTFDPKETKEIRLYGLDDADVFSVKGTEPSPIKVRMIGGGGVDSFYVDKNLNNKSKLFIYDRKDKKNIIPDGSLARIRTSRDSDVNTFDRKNFKYDQTGPIVLANYNTDEGLILIGGIMSEREGFRKSPYASHQSLLAGYSLGRQSFMINYNGDFRRVIGNNDLNISIVSRGPNNVSNFFGVGNNTVFDRSEDVGITYYRNHYNFVNADVRLFHNYNRWQLSGGVTGQLYYSSDSPNKGHFLYTYAQQNPDQKVFDTKGYAGVILGVKFDSRNNITNPVSGVFWNTTVNTSTGIANAHNTYTQVASEFNFYLNPDRDSVLIVANRIGGGTIIGHAEFFQQIKIGGPQNLRGFHTFRFIGKTGVYDNLELRLKLFNFTSYLFPGTFGLIGFNDIGRVWVPDEKSNKWHDGYGGGFFLIPARTLIVQAAVGFSTEGALPYISLGYRF
ncbi:BamA/TamA family outer membrane protein [Mucilaginibacter sp. RS28]|uniref:BamA/TamA family outer membrane protein n=1 Tax=Mucilaginibacter straminoryzae TaxID=2932774 RepID=A0A9X1X0S3_9SPHI|nr:BamA/TamA family outer membrane protein [Mucilaginibacter straminoryzae]MCJ8208521.1 BamA/TamA family outer membrane protein [Mucilaginibacter straminoryzae]